MDEYIPSKLPHDVIAQEHAEPFQQTRGEFAFELAILLIYRSTLTCVLERFTHLEISVHKAFYLLSEKTNKYLAFSKLRPSRKKIYQNITISVNEPIKQFVYGTASITFTDTLCYDASNLLQGLFY